MTQSLMHIYIMGKTRGRCRCIQGCHRKGDAEPYLCALKVEEGDVRTFLSGMVHAIGSGIDMRDPAEFDTTYRVFDWNRPTTRVIQGTPHRQGPDVIDLRDGTQVKRKGIW